ncbi:GIY-YIG nuclease family protein [Soonwooa sp.]|uniref:GIY-YIG nuclease family protein n=1 Tax=Soonwooa sp. TaxID=1938592 RepID=UPI002633B249|nr:GIY-YIG nuclease family protein [Soonwooa sp.]
MDKELKKKYREAFENKKLSMGILGIKNITTGKIFVKASLNADAWINKSKFVLKMGQFENADLQTDWKNSGEDNFAFIMLDKLEENDSPFHDYKKELTKLEAEVLANLTEQKIEMY